MKKTQQLNIYYEGEDYKHGVIDIKELAPSLLAFGELIEEANQILNDGKADIKTYISADFEKKCFKCKLTLESNNLLDCTKDLFGIKSNIDVQELLTLLGFIGGGTVLATGAVITSYIAYKKITKGKKVKEHTVLQDNTVELIIEEKSYKVEFNLFKLIKYTWENKSGIHRKLNQHIEATNGDIGYSITSDDSKISKLDSDSKQAIALEDQNINSNLEAKQDPIITNLKIRMPDLHGNIKWKFLYAGKTIEPDFTDEARAKLNEVKLKAVLDAKPSEFLTLFSSFSSPIVKSQAIFDANSKLPVEMVISYKEDENGETIKGSEHYIITKITGDIITEPERVKLIDDDV
jgi:hypothetical protein